MTVKVTGDISEHEKQLYIQRAEKEHPGCYELEVVVDGEFVDLYYHITPFDRIRRITGYLVGDLNRWNDAKRAEERDRVKHDTANF